MHFYAKMQLYQGVILWLGFGGERGINRTYARV